MIDGFIAKVKSGAGLRWVVEPQIINHDGTTHADLTVGIRDGITPTIDDLVIILTVKNNLDFSRINQFYEASRSNGIIIGIAQTANDEKKYLLDGNYTFRGETVVDGTLTVNQTLTIEQTSELNDSLTVKGNSRSLVTHAELNTALQNMVATINTELAARQSGTSGPGGVSINIADSKTDNIKTGDG